MGGRAIRSRRFGNLVAAPVPVVLTAVFVLAAFHSDASWEPPILVPLLNFAFVGAISLSAAYIAARSYLVGGGSTVLMLGCGMLALAYGGFIGGVRAAGHAGPELGLITHGAAVFLAGFMHAAGALSATISAPLRPRPGTRLRRLGLAYGGLLAVLVAVTLSAVKGVLPPAAVQGQGPTVLRQALLGLAIVQFALSALLFRVLFYRTGAAFFDRYSLAMTLIAAGLVAVFLAEHPGTPLVWTGRIAQYLGEMYLLWAAAAAMGGRGAAPLARTIAAFFRQAEADYRPLVETATEAIISLDETGKILYWNTAAEKMFGRSHAEAVGADLMEVAVSPRFRNVVSGALAKLRGEKEPLVARSTSHVQLMRRDGAVFPAEISFLSRSTPVGASMIAIVRDVSERRRLEREILAIGDAERNSIGQDLHDSLGQNLAAVAIQVKVLRADLAGREPALAARLAEISDMVTESIRQTRTIARGLFPVSLASEGLMTALGDLAGNTSRLFTVDCAFECPEPVDVSDQVVATHLYHIAQEAASNAIKHGRAERIIIRLSDAHGIARLSIRDFGVGLPQVMPSGKGLGLKTMDYRSRMVGGRLSIRRMRSGGTLVSCTFPLGAAEAPGGWAEDESGQTSQPAA